MKPILYGALAGLGGFVLAWSCWHLWVDHQTFHAVVNFLNAQAAQAGKAAK